MKLYISCVNGELGISTTAIDTATVNLPSAFLLALISGEDCYYDGSVRLLTNMIYNPSFWLDLAEQSEKRISDLKKLLSCLEDINHV